MNHNANQVILASIPVTEQSICDALFVQQGMFMRQRGLKQPVIDPEIIKQYAHQCYLRYLEHFNQCVTRKDKLALSRALHKRLNDKRSLEVFRATRETSDSVTRYFLVKKLLSNQHRMH